MSPSNLDAWIDAVIAELGLAGVVDRDHVRSLVLDVARDVAHGVERPAAPVTAYLLGVAGGRAADPTGVLADHAATIAELARHWTPPSS